MDNNKIVDNLNFIKIYFRVFIYKIFVVVKTWIVQKIDKNLRIWIENMSKFKAWPQENLKKRVQNAPKHKSAIGIQEYHSALLECRLALSKCRMAPFWALAQFSSSADKAHPFRFWRVLIHILLVVAYFLSIPASINRD